MMMKLFEKLTTLLLTPFRREFIFMAVLSLLVCAVDVIAWAIYGNFIFGLYLGLHGFIMCYAIVLLGNVLQNEKWRRGYFCFFCLLGFLNFCLDAAVHMTCKTGFHKDFVDIILNTNPAESYEFLSTYITFELVLLIMVMLLFVIFLYRNRVLVNKIGVSMCHLLLLLVLSSTLLIFAKKSENWEGVFLRKIYTFLSYEKLPDLKLFYTIDGVTYHNSDIPDNIVLIIGESFSKLHSSIYGYCKETNPLLTQIMNDSSLVAYADVTSPATSTIRAFQFLMSDFDKENSGVKNWYECSTLIEVLSVAGYKTSWISNQASGGVYDNVIAKYAELCDTTIWVGPKYVGMKDREYDGAVIEKVRGLKQALNNDKNLYIINLMGSHYAFDSRYPESFAIFTEQDYAHLPSNQRAVMATYDNSILYNDYVISELIHLFSAEETILYYCSDHGLDIFNSSDQYYGHSTSSSESIYWGSQIPLFIYMSDIYRSHFPDGCSFVKTQRDFALNTDHLMELILKSIGISYR